MSKTRAHSARGGDIIQRLRVGAIKSGFLPISASKEFESIEKKKARRVFLIFTP
jgi:hypothetical protein